MVVYIIIAIIIIVAVVNKLLKYNGKKFGIIS